MLSIIVALKFCAICSHSFCNHNQLGNPSYKLNHSAICLLPQQAAIEYIPTGDEAVRERLGSFHTGRE